MVVLWNNVVGLEQRFFSCLKSHASLRFGSSRGWKLFLQRSSISNGAASAPRQRWWVVSWISVWRGQASYTLHSTCHSVAALPGFFQTCFIPWYPWRMIWLKVTPWNPHKKARFPATRVWSARQAWPEPWWYPNGPRRVETGGQFRGGTWPKICRRRQHIIVCHELYPPTFCDQVWFGKQHSWYIGLGRWFFPEQCLMPRWVTNSRFFKRLIWIAAEPWNSKSWKLRPASALAAGSKVGFVALQMQLEQLEALKLCWKWKKTTKKV